MSKEITLPQKLMGAAAVVVIAFVAFAPLMSGAKRVSDTQRLLSERRATIAALEERIEVDVVELQENMRVYQRSQKTFDPEAVSQKLNATCTAMAERLVDLQIQQNCEPNITPLSPELQKHTTTLSVSGSPQALLQALDASPAETALDQFRFNIDPEMPQIASLTLSFSDVSRTLAEAP